MPRQPVNPGEVKGRVHSTESFALVDGPGVRFAVFLQGCAMRCQYCHNPETWSHQGEEWTAQALFERAWRCRPYWRGNGGVTMSGGEPLLQMEFAAAFFTLAHMHGVHTALDTAGQPFSQREAFLSRFGALMEVTDLVLLDIKEMDEERHRALTGHGNANILAMARWLSDHGKPMWIRHVLVPGLTDSRESLVALRDFIGTLSTVRRVEVLPYHNMALPKFNMLGIPYPLEGVPVPCAQEVARAQAILRIPQ